MVAGDFYGRYLRMAVGQAKRALNADGNVVRLAEEGQTRGLFQQLHIFQAGQQPLQAAARLAWLNLHRRGIDGCVAGKEGDGDTGIGICCQ